MGLTLSLQSLDWIDSFPRHALGVTRLNCNKTVLKTAFHN